MHISYDTIHLHLHVNLVNVSDSFNYTEQYSCIVFVKREIYRTENKNPLFTRNVKNDWLSVQWFLYDYYISKYDSCYLLICHLIMDYLFWIFLGVRYVFLLYFLNFSVPMWSICWMRNKRLWSTLNYTWGVCYLLISGWGHNEVI